MVTTETDSACRAVAWAKVEAGNIRRRATVATRPTADHRPTLDVVLELLQVEHVQAADAPPEQEVDEVAGSRRQRHGRTEVQVHAGTGLIDGDIHRVEHRDRGGQGGRAAGKGSRHG